MHDICDFLVRSVYKTEHAQLLRSKTDICYHYTGTYKTINTVNIIIDTTMKK